jgi:leucyl-tRNA synthetase
MMFSKLFSEQSGGAKRKERDYWVTLSHKGCMLPEKYEPHHKKVLYKGVPVDLEADQEEVIWQHLTFFIFMWQLISPYGYVVC